MLQVVNQEFYIKLFLSFVIAGFWISGATLLAEKLGSKLGGLISNLPSTILISLLFIALTQNTEFAVQATESVPLGMVIDTLFLFLFIVILPFGLVKATLFSVLSWFLLAWNSIFLPVFPLWIWILIYLLVVVITFYIAEKGMHIHSKPKTGKRYSFFLLSIRALFAGSVVAGAVLVGKLVNPYWAGLFSIFPAVMLSSMVILTRTSGKDFARATGKVMLISSINIVVYGWAVGFFYPKTGIIAGTIMSFTLAAIWVLMMRPLIEKIK